MTSAETLDARRLFGRGRALEAATLAWNVAGVAVLAVAAVAARSVALAGFGLDSLVEIGASGVVLWELAGSHADRRARALRVIRWSFVLLAGYLLGQSVIVLVVGFHPHHSGLGIVWTAATAVVMLCLARGKARVGLALGNPVLQAEGRVTLVDAALAVAVLLGVALNFAFGAWWADPVAALVLVGYAATEARHVTVG